MRIWCVPVAELDDNRLLGEHSELHAMFTVLTEHRKGWRHHPQTIRFETRIGQLVARHSDQADEMAVRGFTHKSPLATSVPPEPYNYTPDEYRADQGLLWAKWGGRFRGRTMIGDWPA